MVASTDRPVVAVIVVSYKVRELLRACLAATYASLARSPELDATVWVIDNASADGSVELVEAEFPQVHLIASPENLGFAGGNNRVLRELGFEESGRGGEWEKGRAGEGESGRIGEIANDAYAVRTTHHAPVNSHPTSSFSSTPMLSRSVTRSDKWCAF